MAKNKLIKALKGKKVLIKKIIIGFIALAVVFVFDFWLFSPKQFSAPTPKPEQPKIGSPTPDTPDTSVITAEQEQDDNFSKPIQTEQQAEEQDEPAVKTSDEILKQIKPEVNSAVPFTTQSPYAKWDDIHNEACEEAVLIMAKYWLDNKEIDKETAEQEILDSVAWQEQNLGGHYDLQVLDIVDLARRYFNIKKIYYSNVNSLNDIKYQLSKGSLVITPMAGRLLDNPYYKRPGPPYHAVVIKGYNDKEIITNDPGTRRGADFSYSYDNFFNAIHNWPYALGEKTGLSKDKRAQEVLKGEKIMIVIEKD